MFELECVGSSARVSQRWTMTTCGGMFLLINMYYAVAKVIGIFRSVGSSSAESSVPWWVVLLVGVLTMIGSIAGGWGAQVIAGRNERARWHREREREAEAHWRDKRLAVYSAVLAAAQTATRGLTISLDPSLRLDREDAEPVLTIEHVADDLRTLWVIGTNEAADLVGAIRVALMYGAEIAKLPGEKQGDIAMEQMRANSEQLSRLVVELRDQFRNDLGIVPRPACMRS